jgi:peptide/nickel transport system permease protein
VAALVGDQTGVVGSSGDTATTVSAAPKPTRRKHGLGLWLPVAWISVIVVGSMLAPWLPLKPNEKTLGKAGLMPNSKFWLGTDQIGRDIFSRVLWGGRVALAVGVVSVISAMVVGGALGLFAGFYRGRLEAVLNTIVNTLLAFPALVLVLAITAFLGHNLWNIVTAIAIVAIPAFARIAYANTLRVRWVPPTDAFCSAKFCRMSCCRSQPSPWSLRPLPSWPRRALRSWACLFNVQNQVGVR